MPPIYCALTDKMYNATIEKMEGGKMQREFISIAAHELRTPVQPILGMADLLELSLGDKDRTEVTRGMISS